ncbi:permease prefix domain 1-containing protein [Deinococcus sp. A31D244]|uniref:permease prefix domain 1-containing protein n=1 Tax=Deinococcus sp. A31D244 TaxID=3397675 RepID=UPI0039E04BA8
MSPEEHYVRNATRGLRGKERQDTQTELLDHLTERTRQLTLTGLNPEQARTQAMQELGPAPTVARSLRRTQHVHPALSAAALLAFATLLLWPVPELLNPQATYSGGDTSESVSELRAQGYLTVREANTQLKPYGIQLKYHGESWELRHAGLPTASIASSENSWNCQGPTTSMAADQPRYWLTDTPSVRYVNPASLLACMSEAEWPLQVRGKQVSLQGKEFPLTWSNDQLTSLYARQVEKSVSQLPQAVWRTPPHYPLNLWNGALIWPWATTTTDLRRITVKSSGQNAVLLIRADVQHTMTYPTERTYKAPIFVSIATPVDEQGNTQIPRSIKTPGQSVATSINLMNSVEDWYSAPISSRPAILVALPDRTDAPIDLTPLTFNP